MTSKPRSYLLVVGDREALGWVLREQRMAFPPGPRAARASAGLGRGDRLLIYTTRSCFRNPGRDRGRVIGLAEITSPIRLVDPPVTFGGAEYPTGCSLRIGSVAPFGLGVELGPLVPQLSFPSAWANHVRRTLVPLEPGDVTVLQAALGNVGVPLEDALSSYLDRAVPVRKRAHVSS